MTNTTTATRRRTDTNGIALIDHALALSNDDSHPTGLIWGLRAVHPDLRSRNGFRWGWPGTWTSVPDETCGKPLDRHYGNETGICLTNTSACPRHEGDGLCVAKTWGGMALGGICATTLLVVGWRPEDLLAEDGEKARVRRAYVRDVIDGARLIREHGSHADLSGADLSGTDLSGADLSHANLTRANLSGADLRRANLQNATLSGAKLSHANLLQANLSYANLWSADLQNTTMSGTRLSHANLSGADLLYSNLWNADLSCANLQDADLLRANLSRANLSHAILRGADLLRADLSYAKLWGADHNAHTRWPDGWDTDRIAQETS